MSKMKVNTPVDLVLSSYQALSSIEQRALVERMSKFSLPSDDYFTAVLTRIDERGNIDAVSQCTVKVGESHWIASGNVTIGENLRARYIVTSSNRKIRLMVRSNRFVKYGTLWYYLSIHRVKSLNLDMLRKRVSRLFKRMMSREANKVILSE